MDKLLKITFLLFMFCYGCFGCIPIEREALLEFKNKLDYPSNRLQSWDNNTGDGDCCQWYGVICSNFSGHVLGLDLHSLSMDEYSDYYEKSAFGREISSSLLNLKQLMYLDLSQNDFEFIPIPKFLGSLRSLRFLDLSYARFGGIIPHEIGNLSNLIYLNLNGDNSHDHSLSIDSLDWIYGLSLLEFLDLSSIVFNQSKSVRRLEVMNSLPSLVELHLSRCVLVHIPPVVLNLNFSSLSVLDLSENYFVESSIPKWVFSLKNLNTLNLADNQFEGPISHHLQNMTSLQELDLSGNIFSLIPKWIFSLRNLISLKLRSNQFRGPIPSELQNVSLIKELDLSYNGFNSSIPDFLYDFSHLEILNLGYNSLSGRIHKSFKNLCTLKSISFSRTKLGQKMNDVLDILSSGCSSSLLESLDLSSCELSGKLSDNLSKFKNLINLRLSNNLITGSIPMALQELKSLRFLLLDHNKLGGSVPIALRGFAKIEQIDISNNLLEGVVTEMHFANLTNLRVFDGAMNQLIRLRVSSDWIPPCLHLQVLSLSGWDIGDQFSGWFHALKYVKVLDLSNSGISSTIPNWFWNSSFQFTYLNLSHNQIHGAIIPDTDLTYEVIDLSSNFFEGPLPRISSNAFLDFSNNSFSGSISHFVCDRMDEEKQMFYLDLGNNLLTGEIPDCWSDSWTSLTSLRLRNNNFSGNIPKSIGNLTGLNYLHLSNNSLSGELPISLQNCGQLKILDLGRNELTGHIPSWISTSFWRMSILILGGNKFHGKIPKEICQLTSLQILDLSSNSLSGDIPNCINDFTFMRMTYFPNVNFSLGFVRHGDVERRLDGAMIMMKGRLDEYQSFLRYLRFMDFSSNNLSGEIPKEITELVQLQSLNLSNNFLSGQVPEDIGVMKGLEALDFSRNQLHGRIPKSMASLTFLSILNLSYNNLSGRIPTGVQMQAFPSSSFIGNIGLWGPPLTDNSTANGNGIEEDQVNWGLYVSIAVGFIVGFWSILCPLFLNRRWRHSYYLFLYNMWNKIWLYFRFYRV